jgi:hypothetical protein
LGTSGQNCAGPGLYALRASWVRDDCVAAYIRHELVEWDCLETVYTLNKVVTTLIRALYWCEGRYSVVFLSLCHLEDGGGGAFNLRASTRLCPGKHLVFPFANLTTRRYFAFHCVHSTRTSRYLPSLGHPAHEPVRYTLVGDCYAQNLFGSRRKASYVRVVSALQDRLVREERRRKLGSYISRRTCLGQVLVNWPAISANKSEVSRVYANISKPEQTTSSLRPAL